MSCYRFDDNANVFDLDNLANELFGENRYVTNFRDRNTCSYLGFYYDVALEFSNDDKNGDRIWFRFCSSYSQHYNISHLKKDMIRFYIPRNLYPVFFEKSNEVDLIMFLEDLN